MKIVMQKLGKLANGIEALLKKTLKDLGASRGSLMVLDPRENVLKIKVAVSSDSSARLGAAVLKNTRVRPGEGISGMVAKTGRSMLINSMDDLKMKFPELKTNTDSSRYESSLVVPIIDGGNTVGVLNINDKTGGGAFTDDDLRLAEMLAEYCGVALFIERQNEAVLHVNEIIREISRTNNIAEVYELVVGKAGEILQCKEVSLMLVEKLPDGASQLVVRESTDKRLIGECRLLGESVSGYVWKTGEPVLIKCIEDGLKDRRFKVLNRPGSFIVAPLNLKYETPYALNVALKSISTIGVLNFTDRLDGQAFTEEQLETIVNYSNLVAIAIEKARFYDDSKRAYLSTVEALSAALGSKDKYTKGHSDKVEQICGVLANKMGFCDRDKEDLQIAAILHDIGKIGIPGDILKKEGRLTKKEYDVVKTHIEEAEKILKHTFYLEGSRAIIATHHEHYDGTGYPRGLKGEEIPLGGRVLAAADAFHAMTSNRPYRKAMPFELAVEELKRCGGKQFDPKVVDIFLAVIDNLNAESLAGD